MTPAIRPTVSVLLPTFNSERFLRETLAGLERQDLTSCEVVVVDDGSTDRTREILDLWSRTTNLSHRVLWMPHNLGVCNALRTGFEVASGEFIAQIGHDDVWRSDHLRTMVEAIGHQHVAAFAAIDYIDERGGPVDGTIFKHHRLKVYERYRLFTSLLRGNFLCAPASIFRKDRCSVSFLGLNNERLQDYQLWLNLLTRGSFGASERRTCSYRLHATNVSRTGTLERQSKVEFFAAHQQVLTSPDFLHFISNLADDRVFFPYIAKHLVDSMLAISEYFPGLALLYSGVLDSLHERHPSSTELREGRMRLASRLGLMRKNLAVGKLNPLQAMVQPEYLPYLIPVGKLIGGEPLRMLVDLGCFRDGSDVDVSERVAANCFVLVHVSEMNAALSWPVFQSAMRDKRVIVAHPGPAGMSDGLMRMPDEARDYNHRVVDAILRFLEDETDVQRHAGSLRW